ncbi:hypothetical protein BH09VER1_BH09VER1_11850 [soil metagenome]
MMIPFAPRTEAAVVVADTATLLIIANALRLLHS